MSSVAHGSWEVSVAHKEPSSNLCFPIEEVRRAIDLAEDDWDRYDEVVRQRARETHVDDADIHTLPSMLETMLLILQLTRAQMQPIPS